MYSEQLLIVVLLYYFMLNAGAVESLAESPAVMTHASVPLEQRQLLGISDNLIRLSIGVEDVDDLIHDLSQAFEDTNLH